METTRHWDLVRGEGPVIATAIHDGHAMRDALQPYLAIAAEDRRREEDPMTGVLAEVGDVRIRVDTSRFEADLNRPRGKAVATDPADVWGLQLWQGDLPGAEVEHSLAYYDSFYALVTELIEERLERWGSVLLVDIHSYNHRRDGPEAPPAPQQGNPDIELGVTTLDPERWGHVARRFRDVLRATPVAGRHPDVRENVRFPTGGHFPEWVYATWGEKVCTISPEYKKTYMDEWTAQADIAAIEDMRRSLQASVLPPACRFCQWQLDDGNPGEMYARNFDRFAPVVDGADEQGALARIGLRVMASVTLDGVALPAQRQHTAPLCIYSGGLAPWRSPHRERVGRQGPPVHPRVNHRRPREQPAAVFRHEPPGRRPDRHHHVRLGRLVALDPRGAVA